MKFHFYGDEDVEEMERRVGLHRKCFACVRFSACHAFARWTLC